MMLLPCILLAMVAVSVASPYDPNDPLLDTVLPKKDTDFEAFYSRQAYGVATGSSRPAHGHATFYQHRHPALIDTNNSPAYGFRFDGKRRFNFD
ncbi:uncharacterized protein LOC111048951 [Nilaparvata lugens]|uniref:uncharacterized protein LOC111048951 n=1 Tax=Nilaparvata lugens TaxID=108931 RepID=UPI000B97ECC4|nr:uncharacterized protein LOC111048951 [Nilaparvata lugens]XP_039286271.1 uncharacterized protein LOC111048951 [Nilaparvata lugens]